ncbi:MAG: ribulose-phosphate 3-epimerase [Flavobacteriales bacterium]
METIVAPSLLSCDFSRIGEESKMLNNSEAQWFHLDVMDGVFVPNISFGMPIIKAFRNNTDKVLDVHAMIHNPDPYIDEFKANGADVLTVHLEACTHLHRTVQAIKKAGMRAGVALNPHTPVSSLADIIHEIDLALIMSVNPGFGGQSFIENSISKVRELRRLIESTGSNALIEVDGGVTLENAPKLVEAGVNVLVAGSTVFKSAKPAETISALRRA